MKRCTKRVFDSKEKAKEHAKAAPFYLRPYKCPHCRQWHLTSETLRERREKGERVT